MENSWWMREISSFLDESGRLTALPAKYKKKLIAYYYLSTKIAADRRYTEPEINDLLNDWALFHDPATLRREMFNKHLLNRTRDCSLYWRQEEQLPPEEFLTKYL